MWTVLVCGAALGRRIRDVLQVDVSLMKSLIAAARDVTKLPSAAETDTLVATSVLVRNGMILAYPRVARGEDSRGFVDTQNR